MEPSASFEWIMKGERNGVLYIYVYTSREGEKLLCWLHAGRANERWNCEMRATRAHSVMQRGNRRGRVGGLVRTVLFGITPPNSAGVPPTVAI